MRYFQKKKQLKQIKSDGTVYYANINVSYGGVLPMLTININN